MVGFHIRLARQEDVSEMEAIIRAAYSDYIPLLGRKPQPMTDDYAELVASQHAYVLCKNRVILGILILVPGDDHILVRTIAIVPEEQGNGLGSFLMAYAEEYASARSIKLLRLYTNEAMSGNVAYYRHLGYRETHRTGEAGVQLVYMEKLLDRK